LLLLYIIFLVKKTDKIIFSLEISFHFLEGLAVGVGFGSIPSSNDPTLSFNQAR
jgi:hypothetical protein